MRTPQPGRRELPRLRRKKGRRRRRSRAELLAESSLPATVFDCQEPSVEAALIDSAAEVLLRHGQPMVIGGMDDATDSAGWALFSWGKTRGTRRMTIVVTPFIEGID